MLTPYAIRSSRSTKHGYRSRQFGYAVTWTEPWVLTDPEMAGTPTADPGSEAVVVRLSSEQATARITGVDRLDTLDPAAIARYWASPAYLAEYMEAGTRVLLVQQVGTLVAVVLVSPGTTPDNPVVTLKEINNLGPRFLTQVSFTVELESLHETFQSLQQCVRIEGRAPLRGIDADLLHAVLP
ncbi:MAG TPA: hypothetical protein VGW38_18085 [Chloroflexota bacterium]|nr:hypothetical protein [Chloroflexota bacterium]